MKTFYIPETIEEDYKYILPSDNYYDLYNTNILTSGHNVTYYRFYYGLEQDLYVTMNETPLSDTFLNTIEIIPSHSLLVRNDAHNIIFTSASIILFIVVLLNICTSILRNGGVFSGLL